MRLQVLAPLVAAAALVAAPARADVRVTLQNGTVSVSATDATIRQILTEWARVGQTRIVNIERLGGGPLTIELANVPEADALDTLLRTVSGYLAAPRATATANASQYDRIFILPTSVGTPPRAAAAAPAVAFTPPPFTPPPADAQDANDDAPPRGGPPVPPNAVRGPAFNTFPQPAVPQREEPQQTQQPQTYPAPTAPVGVATPGMVVPAPPQPGQQPGPVQQGRGGNVR
jgi:hypothetical protein